MRGAEAVSEYTSLPRQEAFNAEYWLLEEAKLQRMPRPKSLSGRIVLQLPVSAGGIGKAIAKKFAEEGACVIINDINEERMRGAMEEFQSSLEGMLQPQHCLMLQTVRLLKSILNGSTCFGGVDIVVNNAGSAFEPECRSFDRRLG